MRVIRREVKGMRKKLMRNTTAKMKISLSGIYRLDVPEGKINELEFKMKHNERERND